MLLHIILQKTFSEYTFIFASCEFARNRASQQVHAAVYYGMQLQANLFEFMHEFGEYAKVRGWNVFRRKNGWLLPLQSYHFCNKKQSIFLQAQHFVERLLDFVLNAPETSTMLDGVLLSFAQKWQYPKVLCLPASEGSILLING